MLKWIFGGKKPGGTAPDYEEAKRVAASKDPKERERLAKASALQPEFLYYFATDSDPNVRRAVAQNEGTPIQADLILARDQEELVKLDLSEKIGRLLPDLSATENQQVLDMVVQVVETLAKDSLPSVRGAIANNIKDLSNVPPGIARRLAQDADEIVSIPILEFSPLLSDDDLIEIVAAGCRGRALAAIASRATVSEDLSEAIVETDDEFAIPQLISNLGAKLSVKVMQSVVDAAENKKSWQQALTGRTDLTGGLLKRMAGYVNKATLDKLVKNNVLVDDALEKELRALSPSGEEDSQIEETQDHEAKRAKELFEQGKLTADLLIRSAKKKEREFLIYALSLLAEADDSIIRKLLSAKDPKLPVSISWHCKLGMKFAVVLQESIMEIPKKSQLPAKGGDSAYPMSDDDMAWSLEVIGI